MNPAMMPRHARHGWMADRDGHAIDTTWGHLGVAYAGVPFDMEWLNLRNTLNEAVIGVIDDYLHNWPILRELGDHPEAGSIRRAPAQKSCPRSNDGLGTPR